MSKVTPLKAVRVEMVFTESYAKTGARLNEQNYRYYLNFVRFKHLIWWKNYKASIRQLKTSPV